MGQDEHDPSARSCSARPTADPAICSKSIGNPGLLGRGFSLRLTAPGHAPLVTQLYVTGDGTLSQPGAPCRHASLKTTPEGVRYQAPDIYLVAQ